MVVKRKSKPESRGLRSFSAGFVVPVLIALSLGVSSAYAVSPTPTGYGANIDSAQPSIKVAVVPNMPAIAYGGLVVYAYTVSNTGTVPLSNVTIADNKCQPISPPYGGTNVDGVLKPNGEPWMYACATFLTTSTVDTATVTGTSGGITVTATGTASVTVGPPPVTPPGSPLVTPPSEPTRVPSSKPAPLPVRLKIPKLNINANIQYVGLNSSGALGVPGGAAFRADVAWYKAGPRPGEYGTAVIDGHSGRNPGPATVFDNLQKLQKGDTLLVQDGKGKSLTFVVREGRIYSPNANAPEVFSSVNGTHLNLITCIWNASAKAFTKRFVVFADLQQ